MNSYSNMHPWNFTELEQKGVCSVDLKLGGSGDLQQFNFWENEQSSVSVAVMVSSPSSGSSKRARGPASGGQIATCSVDGCVSDLSKCRDYHKRHKVCEEHSKTPCVMVGGRQQRFCQQCSRFHLLMEFDEVKRSCRKRLDGHNRRRRKPPLDSLNSGNLITNHQGTSFSSYAQIFPTVASPGTNFPGLIKAEDEPLYYNLIDGGHHHHHHHHFPVSSTGSYKEGKQISYLQDDIAAAAFSRSSSNKKLLHSDRALSLLSSSAAAHTSHAAADDRISLAQPLVPPMQYGTVFGQYARSQASSSVSPTGFSCSETMVDEHGGAATTLVSDDSDADLNCHGLFHVGIGGSSDGNSHSIPFSWQ